MLKGLNQLLPCLYKSNLILTALEKIHIAEAGFYPIIDLPPLAFLPQQSLSLSSSCVPPTSYIFLFLILCFSLWEVFLTDVSYQEVS